MGQNDHLDDDRPELPIEAGDTEARQFDPNDDWIRSAARELQIEAMRSWFYDRYEDPVQQTPYSSGEGGYLFIHGGPYDPSDEIQDRFGGIVDFEVMDELIQELYSEAGDEWAPIDHEGVDYDDCLSMLVSHRSDPNRMLSDRLMQIEAVLTVTGTNQATQLTTQLAHGAVITAVESYLWDTVAFWTANDESTLRDFVATNKDFQAKTLRLSTIFERLEGLKNEVESYLQDLVWHRLDKVKPLMEQGLKIRVPEIGELMQEVLVRHDIVHRGGRTKEGDPVTVSAGHVRIVAGKVRAFVNAIEVELDRRYQIQGSTPMAVDLRDSDF